MARFAAALALAAVAAVVASSAAPVAAAPTDYYGVDVAVAVSQDQFSCLKDMNLRYAIIRCFRSVGRIDSNCAANVQNAQAAGMEDVAVYAFPDPKAGNGAGQASTLTSYISQNSLSVSRVWFDVEAPGTYWGSSTSANVQFMKDFVGQLQSAGLAVGIYASASQYPSIAGSDTSFSNLPIWYARYGGDPTFADFQPFNGWTSAYMHQFSDAGSHCGVSYDINWRPSL